MLSDLLNHFKLQNARRSLQRESQERLALYVLAGCAWLIFLICVLVFVLPVSLPTFWYNTQLRLSGLSLLYPALPWVLVVSVLLWGGLYFVGWHAVQRTQSRAAWMVVIWGAVASSAALLFVYPFGSTDVFDYIVHGRMIAFHGANPFHIAGVEFRRDLFYPYMGWPAATSAYGPLWESLAAGVAWAIGDDVIANVVAFKLLSGAFLAGSAYVVYAILRKLAPRRALPGVLLLLWNPVLLYETFANGHNDMVMVFWILAAVWAILNNHYTSAILALIVGALVKFMPLLLIPAAAAVALRRLPDARARMRFIVTAAVLGAAVIVFAYWPFWTGIEVLSIGRREELFTTSLASVARAWSAPIWGADQASTVISRIAAGVTVLWALFEAVRAWRDRSPYSFAHAGFRILAAYLLLTVLWFMSWYSLWLLGMAPILANRRYARLAQVFAFATLIPTFMRAPPQLLDSALPEKWYQLGMAVSNLGIPWMYAVWSYLTRGRTPAESTAQGLESARK